MNGVEPTMLSGGYGLYLVQTLLALGAVCLLAWIVLRWGLKRVYGRGREGRLMRVVDRLPLEPRRALWVVEVAGRYLLLSTSEQGSAISLKSMGQGSTRRLKLPRPRWTEVRPLNDRLERLDLAGQVPAFIGVEAQIGDHPVVVALAVVRAVG